MSENAEPLEQSPPPDPARPKTRRWWWIPVLALVVVVGGFLYWPRITASGKSNSNSSKTDSSKNGKGGRGGDATAATPVIGIRAHKGDIGVYYSGLGSVTPIYTVTVKSRVDGELMNIRYQEGDLVHKGDLLIQIDPRPFQVQLTQAEGQYAKDQAALENGRIDLTRYQTLLQQSAIPEQQVATQKATVAQDERILR